MSRRSIYKLLEEKSLNPKVEYARLCFLLKCYYFDKNNRITFLDHIKKETFYLLPVKGTCVNLDDLLSELGINLDSRNATMDELFDLIEFIICIIDSEQYGYQKNRYEMFANNIGIILEKSSHTLIETKNGRIVVPKDAKIEQAATLAKTDNISLELLTYNHRANNGNLENKAKILTTVAKHYENELKKSKDSLSKDIGFLLNNFNIRHNNKEQKGNNSKFINDMSKKELEQWYDNLYTLFIAFIVQSEQENISLDIKKLKRVIVEKSHD